MAQRDVTAGGGDRAQKGAGLDAVGHHLVRGAVQALDALDANAARAMALDARAHADQQLGQVGDFGFLGGVFQHRLAFGQRSGHEEVLGSGDGHHVGGDARAAQAAAAGRQARHHVAVLDLDLRAHGLQALDVLVHRPRADGAATRQRHPRAAKARQQRAQHQHRRAHGLDQLVRRLGVEVIGSDEAHAAALAVGLRGHTHVVEQVAHGAHVVQTRHVDQMHRRAAEQRGAHLGQRGVLGAGDQHLTLQRTATADQQFVHAQANE